MAECATDRRAVLPCDTRSRAGEAARLRFTIDDQILAFPK